MQSDNWKFSAQAENALAGCLLVKPEETLREIREIITADDCELENVKAIYRAAAALRSFSL